MELFIICIFLVSIAGTKIDNIECPIPGNPSSVTIDDCIYPACEFTNEKCHMKKNDEAGYMINSDAVDTGRGFKVALKKIDPTVTFYGEDILDLELEFIYHEEYHLQIKISDPTIKRYEIPFPLNIPTSAASTSLYDISYGNLGQPLVIDVSRKSNGNSIFRDIGPLTFESQFIQFSISLASYHLYGLGENFHTSLMHTFVPRKTFPIFASDKSSAKPEEYNHYGAHPYYVNVEDSQGNTHSVLFYNSNAMEYSTFLLDDGTPSLTFRTIGGIVDLHIFMGPTPEEVNIQYAQAGSSRVKKGGKKSSKSNKPSGKGGVMFEGRFYDYEVYPKEAWAQIAKHGKIIHPMTIGLPNMPPYWALGFSLSRYGYGSTANYRTIRERMKAEEIPMDVQTFDIDYMDGRRDFTYDPVNWVDFPILIQELHDEDIYVTVIFDPAIAIEWDSYPPSQRGKDADVFVKWISSTYVPDDQPEGAGDYIVGRVWPTSPVVFPDFLKPTTREWWTNETVQFHKVIKFDAMWIDMNEPSNFETNLHIPTNNLFCPMNQLDEPPYGTKATFNDVNLSKKLSDGTICMSTFHEDEVQQYLHYDTHSLYGLTQSMATFNTMETLFPGMRKALLSRSTFPGSGKYAIHWLGDNVSSWVQMQLSIIGMIEFNMFGFPMVGADICGFIGDSDEELCGRWMQLGAFYPYCRNHNELVADDQDPARWPKVAEISRNVLALRYKYLPFLFSLLHRASSDGHSVIRPLFNVFPTDPISRDVDSQFLWGDGIMIAPVLVPYAITRGVYFPKSLWYDLESGELSGVGPETKTVDAPIEKIPVYVRGGIILPFQNPSVTTTHSRRNGFGFTVALDENLEANGEVFWDDGITDQPSSASFLAIMTFDGTEFKTLVVQNEEQALGVPVETIQFYGFPRKPTAVTINGISLSETFWNYNSTTSVLQVKESVPLNSAINLIIDY